MAIVIQNISGDNVPDSATHDYTLKINYELICRFQHRRDEGLAQCLRQAADAVDAARQGAEWIKSGDRERAARALCFKRCSAGKFLDPENGCVSVCKSADECQGWRALVHEVSSQR